MISRLLLVLLTVLVFISAIQLVVIRHQNRQLFIQLQHLQRERDELNIEWGKLQLELNTWARPSRIERLARQRLEMSVPSPESIVVIRVEQDTR